MLCAMMATGIWLIIATYWELPVSTTHSIVGAIIGMTMVSAGPSAIIWSSKKDTFPYIGVSSALAGWVGCGWADWTAAGARRCASWACRPARSAASPASC